MSVMIAVAVMFCVASTTTQAGWFKKKSSSGKEQEKSSYNIGKKITSTIRKKAEDAKKCAEDYKDGYQEKEREEKEKSGCYQVGRNSKAFVKGAKDGAKKEKK